MPSSMNAEEQLPKGLRVKLNKNLGKPLYVFPPRLSCGWGDNIFRKVYLPFLKGNSRVKTFLFF